LFCVVSYGSSPPVDCRITLTPRYFDSDSAASGGDTKITILQGLLIALVTLAISLSYAEPFPHPKVLGPIGFARPAGGAANDYPFYSQADWLAGRDYVEEEFFLEGMANAYDMQDGSLVRRPAAEADFNGTVILKWQNVTAGYDLDALWSSFRDDFVVDCYAWVGISAQRVGVNQLREWSPTRYGTLDVTNGGTVERDAISYDIFGQAAQAIRTPQGTNVMGGFAIRGIIGEGASQSAGCLAPFYNIVMPRYSKSIDLLFLAVGGGETRDDLDISVIRILAETDVLGRAARTAELPVNSGKEITWEIAGTSHSSYEGFIGRLDVFARDQGSPANMPADGHPLTLKQAIARLEAGGLAPEVKISGQITDVCQAKGCWMILVDGDVYARVTFYDYGFFVPIETSMQRSIVFGVLTESVLSGEQAEHYAQDAGAQSTVESTGEVKEYSILAKSVQLENRS
jgi:hypothetical protein